MTTHRQHIFIGALCALLGFLVGDEVGRAVGAHQLFDLSHSFNEMI